MIPQVEPLKQLGSEDFELGSENVRAEMEQFFEFAGIGGERLCYGWGSRSPAGHTASSIRKFIRPDYPVGLNPVLRAVRELAAKKLITCVGTTKQRSCKLYRLTPLGRAIVRQLQC